MAMNQANTLKSQIDIIINRMEEDSDFSFFMRDPENHNKILIRIEDAHFYAENITHSKTDLVNEIINMIKTSNNFLDNNLIHRNTLNSDDGLYTYQQIYINIQDVDNTNLMSLCAYLENDLALSNSFEININQQDASQEAVNQNDTNEDNEQKQSDDQSEIIRALQQVIDNFYSLPTYSLHVNSTFFNSPLHYDNSNHRNQIMENNSDEQDNEMNNLNR